LPWPQLRYAATADGRDASGILDSSDGPAILCDWSHAVLRRIRSSMADFSPMSEPDTEASYFEEPVLHCNPDDDHMFQSFYFWY
jgi:hypothetical protein